MPKLRSGSESSESCGSVLTRSKRQRARKSPTTPIPHCWLATCWNGRSCGHSCLTRLNRNYSANTADFLVTDSYLFPMEAMADFESMNEIRTVRISPIDAKRAYSNRTLSEKLCGKSLGHFSGILKRSWRANDILWGRLDGCCQLIECLMTQDRLKQLPQTPLGNLVNLVFPNADPADLDQLAKAPDPNDKPRFDAFVETLVRAAQAEILAEEAPVVIDASVRQHADWNQFPVQKEAERELFLAKQVWRISPRRLDSGVTSYAAAQLAAGLRPEQGGWARYFDVSYRVGAETWKDGIPATILGEMGTQAARVLRKCLLKSAGTAGKKIEGSWADRVIDTPLSLVNALRRMSRTAPEYASASYVVFVLSLGVLLMEAPQFRKAVFGQTNAHWPLWEYVLIPGAVAALILGWNWFMMGQRRVMVKATKGIMKALREIHECPLENGDLLATQICATPISPGAAWLTTAANAKPVNLKCAHGATGVLDCRAYEKANRRLRNQIAKSVFECTVWQRSRTIKIKVENVRRLSVLDMKEIRFDKDEFSPGDKIHLIPHVYEGTVHLVVTPKEKTPSTSNERDALEGRGFRLRSEDGGVAEFVSMRPIVFAYVGREGVVGQAGGFE